jgi:hypothetical protein
VYVSLFGRYGSWTIDNDLNNGVKTLQQVGGGDEVEVQLKCPKQQGTSVVLRSGRNTSLIARRRQRGSKTRVRGDGRDDVVKMLLHESGVEGVRKLEGPLSKGRERLRFSE